MRPQTHYKKPKKAINTAISTIRIIITFASLAIFGIIFYYAATNGWESVFAWFGGKYFCMVVMILVFAITAGAWLVQIVKTMRRAREDE